MWNSIKAEMESGGKTFADEDTTERSRKEEYHKIADRRVRLGLVLSRSAKGTRSRSLTTKSVAR